MKWRQQLKKWISSYAAVLSIVWFLLIFAACAIPGQYIPSTNWLDWFAVDKWVHAILFFVMNSLLILLALKRTHYGLIIFFATVFCILYGISLELMQAYVFSNRSADWVDAMANAFGSLMALLLVKKVRTNFID
jgi:TRAP-type uncharacterized transport system fused permease subunit